jgi:type II secretion system protein G
MSHGIVRFFRRNDRRGFTLVELLVVIVVLAVLAAIVLPKFVGASQRSRESALRADLKLLRNAVSAFNADTGTYPASLADLAATTAPAAGKSATGTDVNITASDWHGPYIEEVPTDPISSGAFGYSTASGSAGKVTSAATGYTTW